VNTSGGSPAAIAERSFAVLVVATLGMLVSVTWIPGCVLLNCVTIWLSNCNVDPDHIVHHVRWTTGAALLRVAAAVV
jgi:hypothetical protein